MYRYRSKGSNEFNHRMQRWWVETPETPPPKYPYEPPEIRRRVIVEDYDYGRTVRHEFVLLRSGRIDCYRVSVDGKLLPKRMGWAKVLEMIRKAFLRATTRVFD